MGGNYSFSYDTTSVLGSDGTWQITGGSGSTTERGSSTYSYHGSGSTATLQANENGTNTTTYCPSPAEVDNQAERGRFPTKAVWKLTQRRQIIMNSVGQ